jgi:hypothetical protein
MMGNKAAVHCFALLFQEENHGNLSDDKAAPEKEYDTAVPGYTESNFRIIFALSNL